MSELRQNPISGDWVIIASKRGKRPNDFKTNTDRQTLITDRPQHKDSCPFCTGNEKETPPEKYRIGTETAWQTRVCDNKFAALTDKEPLSCDNKGLYRTVSGTGIHEVIIEHPHHNICTALMSENAVTQIIQSYHHRAHAAYANRHIHSVILFKNHGATAGTSLEHPHSQLIALPLVAPYIETRMLRSKQYFDTHQQCLMCAIAHEEIRYTKRLICETDHFISFIPYAALSPYHTWIFPKRHTASFLTITDYEIQDLARQLRTILRKFYFGLDNPDFNYVIRTLPDRGANEPFSHWYLSIVPRMSYTAGFEVGAGIYINSSQPETSAEHMRSIIVPA